MDDKQSVFTADSAAGRRVIDAVVPNPSLRLMDADRVLDRPACIVILYTPDVSDNDPNPLHDKSTP
jgi:hypothetical protein